MNLGLVNDLNESRWFDGYASTLTPFKSRTVSLLVKSIPNFGSKIAFNLLINFVARSIFGTLLLYHFVKLKIALSPDRVCGTELAKSNS
jgi:hypothetical protein